MSDLRSFMKDLEKHDELVRITDELSPKLEISAALKRFDGGKALLFENVAGYDNKVIGGVCATRERIIRGLRLKPEELYLGLSEASHSPKKCRISDGPIKEVVEEGDLSKIPILTHFNEDSGPYITSGVLYARSPDGSIENVSFHRLQLLDKKKMTIRIVPRHLYRLTQMAKQAGLKSMDVSVSIRAPPDCASSCFTPLRLGGVRVQCSELDSWWEVEVNQLRACRRLSSG